MSIGYLTELSKSLQVVHCTPWKGIRQVLVASASLTDPNVEGAPSTPRALRRRSTTQPVLVEKNVKSFQARRGALVINSRAPSDLPTYTISSGARGSFSKKLPSINFILCSSVSCTNRFSIDFSTVINSSERSQGRVSVPELPVRSGVVECRHAYVWGRQLSSSERDCHLRQTTQPSKEFKVLLKLHAALAAELVNFSR